MKRQRATALMEASPFHLSFIASPACHHGIISAIHSTVDGARISSEVTASDVSSAYPSRAHLMLGDESAPNTASDAIVERGKRDPPTTWRYHGVGRGQVMG